MPGLQKNLKYNDLYVEAQKNHVTVDPFGKRYIIYQGMQFKFDSYQDIEVGCGCGGVPKELLRNYNINALATCQEGQYLWQTPKGLNLMLVVSSKYFIETDSLKYPAVVNAYEDETSGKDTDLFTPPWKRSIPRTGGVWYTDPWESQKGG
jgi:hypothetical protein